MHTYTHHFIPIHTYIHTTDHVTPQYVATNFEFFVKNTLYENGSNTLILQQIGNKIKILNPQTHIYLKDVLNLYITIVFYIIHCQLIHELQPSDIQIYRYKYILILICRYTYTYPFIPIHTHTYIHTYIHIYIHTTDHVTPQYGATNLQFFVKNTPYGNGSSTFIFLQICKKKIKFLNPQTHI